MTAQSLTPEATDEKLGWVRDAAGDRFDDLEIQTLVGFVHVTDDADGIAEGDGGRVRRLRRRRACSRRRALVGTEDEHRRRRSKSGASAGRCRTTSSTIDAIDTFAPVVARLAGK